MTDVKRDVRLAAMRAAREAYVSTARMAELEAALVAQGFGAGAARRMLASHLLGRCPGCQTDGFYLWRFLGRMSHPECGRAWVVNPCHYLKKQAGWGITGALDMGLDVRTAMQEGLVFTLATGCLFGLIRIPIVVALLPLQTLVWAASNR